MNLVQRLRAVIRQYPGQFWLLFTGMLISTTGSSMIWPFLMLYVSKKLALPLAQTATLMTINAVMGLVFSFIAGPIIDRLGRKWVMVISLVGNGFMYILLSNATTYAGFALAQALTGALNPLYRVGADAMMADLIPAEKRPGAYSIMRMSNNTGVAIGPAIGGIIASTSYTTAFYLAAAGMVLYGLLVTLRAHETLPQQAAVSPRGSLVQSYAHIFRDKSFMGFVGSFTLTSMLASLVWSLLPVYANTSFGISESRYGFLPTTNALMVVFLQYAVTQVTKRYKALPVMAVGTAFYALAVSLVAFSRGYWGFWICMVIMTIGELIISPTATTYTADLAPADMRGRYMSIYGLTWSAAMGIAPVVGGSLSDNFGPRSTWYGGAVLGLVAVLAYVVLKRRSERSSEIRESRTDSNQ